jgi:uncharacterized membrane protein
MEAQPMESKVKVLGHPVHPFLVVYPVALLSVSVLFDALYQATGTADFARFAFWSITIGVAVGLGAALFGLVDWLGIRSGSRAKRIGAYHGLGNVVVVLLFVVSWAVRLGDLEYDGILPFVLGLVGLGIALVTAWLGGELVYRLRIGVDDDAHEDAPSSLGGSVPAATEVARDSGRPARVT